jgi:hypothetical protein
MTFLIRVWVANRLLDVGNAVIDLAWAVLPTSGA